MRATGIKAIVGSLAGAAFLIGAGVGQDAVAAMQPGIYLIQPSETHPGFMLPPISDHLNVAQLNDDEAALERDDAAAQVFASDSSAEGTDIVQIVEFVLVPTTIGASDADEVGSDGTAQQYDRGYYQDPEVVVAMIIAASEVSNSDGEDSEE